ncbi:MAG TPA: XdhC family protein [Gemmatimonadaceae bacterium]|nr:XdhC family protein [Gemmatimonadaceae bacterium]
MRETLEQLDLISRNERRVAMATLVAVKGTTPRKEGAKMWVGAGGRILGSVTIGGCVDARVVAESEGVLRSGTPRLLSIAMSDQDAWDLGLTCGGVVDVLLEPVELRDDDDELVRAYQVIREETRAGRHAAMVTTLDAAATRHMVVLADGGTAGTLGDAPLDDAARQAAREWLGRGASRTVTIEAAGASRDVFIEVHAPAATLLVFGAGHVAIPLVAMAKTLGWHTVVMDGRERYATRERFPEADEIRIGALGEMAETLSYDASTVVVLVAHDYKFELPVLRAVLRRSPAYIGLLGGRRRARALLDFLATEGFDADALARVHVPVGLDIGAQTAAEIAVAILAEAIAVRAGRSGASLQRSNT